METRRSEKWLEAVREIETVLTRRAARREPIFYGDLTAKVNAIRFKYPNDFGMAAILREVPEDTTPSGGAC